MKQFLITLATLAVSILVIMLIFAELRDFENSKTGTIAEIKKQEDFFTPLKAQVRLEDEDKFINVDTDGKNNRRYIRRLKNGDEIKYVIKDGKIKIFKSFNLSKK